MTIVHKKIRKLVYNQFIVLITRVTTYIKAKLKKSYGNQTFTNIYRVSGHKKNTEYIE